MTQTDDYRTLVTDALLDETTFVRAVFSGVQRGHDLRWTRAVVRPVMLKSGRHLQISTFDDRQDITKNYDRAQQADAVADLLGLPFKNIHVHTTVEDIQVRFTKKGKAMVSYHRADPAATVDIDLSHDRQKQTLIDPTDSAARDMLTAVGIMTRDGTIKADMTHKFKQIDKFLRLLTDSGALDRYDGTRPVDVVDAGCGSGYLTFALYYYLTMVQGWPVRMIGVDFNGKLLTKLTRKADDLGYDGLTFAVSTIADYHPPEGFSSDIVIALHACDTATDEAIAQGIAWDADAIFCAPCCHHHLQAQLDTNPTPLPYQPLLRHGILRERLGDILTDTFRVQALRTLGYRADIVEFVDSEHTPKNLLIRAVHTNAPGDPNAVAEYDALKAEWSVTPYLETLLARA